jgi:triosephosphate isomerase
VFGNFYLAAQNMHWASSGAHTGEISAGMLKALGVTHVILGHSERRAAGETDWQINQKVRAALAAGLTPIFCFGETLEQRRAEQKEAVIRFQIESVLAGLTPDEVLRIIGAYEPVWAIGTGETATPQQADEVLTFVRNIFWQRGDAWQEVALKMRLLYGGSVKPDSAPEIMALGSNDGVLVGGAFLKADDFAKIIDFDGRLRVRKPS